MTRAPDRRVARTRTALKSAFTQLFFKHGYEFFTVADVAKEANVGRSTFYEHFDSKEAVLWACMSQFFTVFADAIANDTPPEPLLRVLEHLWQNRRNADAVFSGTPRIVVSRSLAELIEARLKQLIGRRRPAIAPRLAAIQLAESQLVLVDTWLRGKVACPPDALRDALHASSRANAQALMFGLQG